MVSEEFVHRPIFRDTIFELIQAHFKDIRITPNLVRGTKIETILRQIFSHVPLLIRILISSQSTGLS